MEQAEEDREVLLKVEHLCQYFKMGKKELKAVDDVSFDIKRGEVFGLVGESGCGKTTTGRSIIKLYNITSGNVYFKGVRVCAGSRSYRLAIAEKRKQTAKEIKRLKEEIKDNSASREEKAAQIERLQEELSQFITEQNREKAQAMHDHRHCDKEHADKLTEQVEKEYEGKLKQAEGNEEDFKRVTKEYKNRLRIAKKSRLTTQIQMIFQDPIASLDPRMTVKEIIAEGLVINGIKDKEYITQRVYEVLETVGLVREHANRYPHEFSGGQRQRIGIARAVIMNPEMIIADEPVSALDVSIQAQVINLLNDLRDRFGLTILFIAHDLSVVKYFSDRIGVMYFGKMVELATADELFAHPLHPYTKSLLSAIPLPDPHYEKGRVRITYNPIAEHDYEEDKPTMREVAKGHFVYCNNAEEEKYKKQLEENKSKGKLIPKKVTKKPVKKSAKKSDKKTIKKKTGDSVGKKDKKVNNSKV